jgi:hypothetical protein
MSLGSDCKVEFPKYYNASSDPLALNRSEWGTRSRNCQEIWTAAYKEQFQTIDLLQKQPHIAIQSVLETAQPLLERRNLRLVVLLYSSFAYLKPLINFCSLFTSEALNLVCYEDVYKKMLSFGDDDRVEMLILWFRLMQIKASDMISPSFLQNANKSKSVIISRISIQINNIVCLTTQPCNAYMQLDKQIAALFVPDIIAEFKKPGYKLLRNLKFLQQQMRSTACLVSEHMVDALKFESLKMSSKDKRDKELRKNLKWLTLCI